MVVGMSVDGKTGYIQALIERDGDGLATLQAPERFSGEGEFKSHLLGHFMLAYAQAYLGGG